MIKKPLLVLLLALSTPVKGDVAKDLHEFFNQVTDSNITKPGAYKGQEGGFYTGGTLFARTPTRNIQLANLQIPRVEAGCSGIDLHLGGWGYINSQKMIETLKAIGANAAGYAFSLALKQMSPQIMSQLEELQAWMNEANWNNINSCQMAQQLINNSASYFHESTVRTCIQQELKAGKDYFSGRQACQAQAKVNARNNQARESGERVIDNVNIVWQMMQTNPVLKLLDKEIKFLLMSLTGTLVVRTEGDNPPQARTYPSKLESADVIYQLSTGKNLSLYTCSDEACLTIVEKTLTLAPEHTFVGKILNLLQGMEEKVIKDEAVLTPQEKAFLEATSLPVYKMLNVYAAFGRGTSLLFPSQYTEVIAMDVLYRYIESGISDVLQTLHEQDLPESLQKKLLSLIQMGRQRAKDLRLMQLQKTGTIDDMVAKVQMMEKQITALVSAQLFSN